MGTARKPQLRDVAKKAAQANPLGPSHIPGLEDFPTWKRRHDRHAQRAWLRSPGYFVLGGGCASHLARLAPGSGLERAKPVGVGEVMTGESVCEVIASDEAGYGPK
jgi:hypothetical protein